MVKSAESESVQQPSCTGQKANGQTCTRRATTDGRCWQHPLPAATTPVRLVPDHGHRWDPITGVCTTPGCEREKPTWLIEAEHGVETPARPGGWSAIPGPVRWLLLLVAVSYLVTRMVIGFTGSMDTPPPPVTTPITGATTGVG